MPVVGGIANASVSTVYPTTLTSWLDHLPVVTLVRAGVNGISERL
jgi:hypothetical protein